MVTARALLVPSFLLLACASARANGRVQLALTGEIAPAGGARIELDCSFDLLGTDGVRHGVGQVHLGLYLAQKTSAADVAALLESELVRAGAVVIRSVDARDTTHASLFVENTSSVGLRLGRGLGAQVCLCEEAPSLVRFLPPKEQPDAAHFALTSSWEHPHTKDRGRFELAVDFANGLSGEQAADLLTTGAIKKGWTGQWLNHAAWNPQNLQSGARVTGTCIVLESKGDWRIEIENSSEERAR